MEKNEKIFVAGHQGMVGSAIKRRLEALGYSRIITCSLDKLNLMDQGATRSFFEAEKPRYVFLAAAKVGGIKANDEFCADFIYKNLMIECNTIHSCYAAGVKKLLFLGSSCIYPRLAPQPIPESSLLTGLLEPTNEAYAIAKIAGIKLCQMYRKQYGCDFISAMPTNLYGTNDNYHPENSHVIPALIRRFHEAKVKGLQEVVCWGTGTPRREFLFVDDLADACVFLMNNYSGYDHVNVGSGSDITIRELAEKIARCVGFSGSITWDATKPDGMPRKLLDIEVIKKMGWQKKIGFETGLEIAYEDFCKGGVRL